MYTSDGTYSNCFQWMKHNQSVARIKILSYSRSPFSLFFSIHSVQFYSFCLAGTLILDLLVNFTSVRVFGRCAFIFIWMCESNELHSVYSSIWSHNWYSIVINECLYTILFIVIRIVCVYWMHFIYFNRSLWKTIWYK